MEKEEVPAPASAPGKLAPGILRSHGSRNIHRRGVDHDDEEKGVEKEKKGMEASNDEAANPVAEDAKREGEEEEKEKEEEEEEEEATEMTTPQASSEKRWMPLW